MVVPCLLYRIDDIRQEPKLITGGTENLVLSAWSKLSTPIDRNVNEYR
jgi:hypothetical protein